MAKRKTPKVKDLRPEKISDSQLNKVKGLVNAINRAQLELGIMESKKHSMLHGIAGIQDELTSLQETFNKEYGTYDINIQDGTINYQKENGEVNKKN